MFQFILSSSFYLGGFPYLVFYFKILSYLLLTVRREIFCYYQKHGYDFFFSFVSLSVIFYILKTRV